MIFEWSEEANDNLYDIPFKGREGRIGGTRELIVRPRYILVYEVWPDKVFILAVLHTSRKWPYEQV